MGSANFNTIQELLEGAKIEFQVPPYQRGYDWKGEEWRDLWLDINRIEQRVGTHFLGNVILLDKENNTLEIVDGQQRITTISILLMAIRDSDNWEGVAEDSRIDTLINYRPSTERKRKLKLNDPDADESYENIWNENVEQSQGEILDAYEYYINKLQSLQHDEIEDLLDKVVENLRVVRTQLNDPALAYPIFQSQNARGKEVPPHILATSRVHGESYKLGLY